jgi:hypothetical protein
MQAETSVSSKALTSPWLAARDLMKTSTLGLLPMSRHGFVFVTFCIDSGYRAFYRGFLVSTLGSAPSTMLYLGLYNKLKEEGLYLCDRNSVHSEVTRVRFVCLFVVCFCFSFVV